MALQIGDAVATKTHYRYKCKKNGAMLVTDKRHKITGGDKTTITDIIVDELYKDEGGVDVPMYLYKTPKGLFSDDELWEI